MDFDIIKIITAAMVGIAVINIVRSMKPEFTVYIVIATSIVIFVIVVDKLAVIFKFLNSIYSEITYGKIFFPILFKVLAIAYITDFTAQLCRDTGEGAIAAKTELAGKIIIFYISVPVLVAILELINTAL